MRQDIGEKLTWILMYSLCSSSMLVVNKLAVAAVPLPTLIAGAQLVSSAIVPMVLQGLGFRVIARMTQKRIIPYVFYTMMFAAGLFANMKALLLTNVGAVIAARCCLPVIVSLIEFFFMGRSFPNKRSQMSLLGVVLFAYLYVQQDSGVAVEGSEGFMWLFIWWLLLALQMTYGKWMTSNIEMTQWERVFYTNAFAIPPNVVIWYFSADSSYENAHIMEHLDSYQKNMLILSCIIGCAISYSGWRCRSCVTATTFTLVGVVNKMATIAFTMVVWPKETTLMKVSALVFCVLFGLLYQEAPMKKGKMNGGLNSSGGNIILGANLEEKNAMLSAKV